MSGPVVAATGGVRTVAQPESKRQIGKHKKSKEVFITPSSEYAARSSAYLVSCWQRILHGKAASRLFSARFAPRSAARKGGARPVRRPAAARATRPAHRRVDAAGAVAGISAGGLVPSPTGTRENSPAIYRWVQITRKIKVPQGRKKRKSIGISGVDDAVKHIQNPQEGVQGGGRGVSPEERDGIRGGESLSGSLCAGQN